MSIVAFQDPPSTRTQRSLGAARYRLVAEQLKERPGEWALVDDDWWQSLKNQIESGTIVAFQPAGSFEATATREDRHKPQRAAIHARYVGTEGVASLPRITSAVDALAAVRELYETLVNYAGTDQVEVAEFGAALADLEARAS